MRLQISPSGRAPNIAEPIQVSRGMAPIRCATARLGLVLCLRSPKQFHVRDPRLLPMPSPTLVPHSESVAALG